MPIVVWLAGVAAVAAAIRARRALTSQLGAGWAWRFLVVQAVVINGIMTAVVVALAARSGLPSGVLRFGTPAAYLVLYFFYSLSNVDWTARKFHTVAK